MVKKLFHPRRITPAHAFFFGALLALFALGPAIFPYGGQYVTRGDYIEQQLPLILETKRIITEGKSYSFNTLFGAPSVGSYAFYTLGSIFVWPLCLLPDTLIPYGISVMAILKHAVCALISFIYFRKMVREERLALLGSVLYTFSSFTVVNTQFYHFTEVIAFFPLILLGLEIAMSERPRPGLLALFCGLNALTNYYFMLASALLAGLYFVFRFFSADWKPARSLRRCAVVVFECAVGCALSGVLLLPAMHFMLGISRSGFDPSQLTQTYSLTTLLERLRTLMMPIESNVVHAYYGEAGSWCSTAAYLPVFGLTGAVVFLFKGKARWLKALLAALALCCAVPALCGAFALFTNMSYTRWWYGLALMLTLATLYALREAPLSGRAWRISCAACSAVVAALILPAFLPEALLEAIGFSGVREGAFAGDEFRILSLLLTLLGGGAMLLLIKKPMRSAAAMLLIGAVACVQYAGCTAINDVLVLSGGTEPDNGVYTLSEIAEGALGSLEYEPDGAYTRIDYRKKLRNYGLLRGQSSLTCFSSMRAKYVSVFAELAGFGIKESPSVAPPNSDPTIRAFLSVSEYHQLEGETPPEGFVYDREENGYAVYVNENAVPMGFLQTTYTGTYDQPMNEDTIGKTMLAAAALDAAEIEKIKGKMDVLDVYHIPDWQQSAARLKENACDSFETNPDSFTAHIDAKEAGLLVFTIPYDKGFTARIDGEEAEIIRCDVAFMSVWVEPGEHEIIFTYKTRSLNWGVAMTLMAAATLGAYMLLCKKKKIRIA